MGDNAGLCTKENPPFVYTVGVTSKLSIVLRRWLLDPLNIAACQGGLHKAFSTVRKYKEGCISISECWFTEPGDTDKCQ